MAVSHSFLGLGPESWTALAAWITLLVLTVTARLALIQIRDARQLREEEARPVVVVDLDSEIHPHILYIYFQNLGRTTAYDVRLVFSPRLRASQAEQSVQQYFDHSFPTLPPGKRMQSVWDSTIAILADTNVLPTCYTVTVTYRDRTGKEFNDRYVLDAGVFQGWMFASKKDIGDVVLVLEKIQSSIASQK